MRAGTVPACWPGETVIIAASGPSLKESVDVIQRLRVQGKPFRLIVVNTTFRLFPWADVLYAGDMLWWRAHHQEVAKTFKGEKWGGHQTIAQQYRTQWAKNVNRPGLSTDNSIINNNGNSGFQAINLAYLFGSRRILLVGFDMKLGADKEKHWHPDHPKPCVQAQVFSEWIHKAATLAKDLERHKCEVINCSAETALTCWPRSFLTTELESHHGTR
jgi:hypothetical protein